jgi:ABC-type polysaccharide/polyol phosphate transport system ATPase subunit
MTVIELDRISKGFMIPSVRRDTLREHVLGALQPRRIDRLTVLDSLSLQVERGETLGIMGRNGSGKSTLLKIICGIYRADRGTVAVRAGVTPILELGVGWNPELDAVDNVLLIGSVMGLSLRALHASMARILAFAELERFANLQLKYYSSGMAARLAYAVAFHAVRDVLVLDEIFAVGDVGFRMRCFERYRELHAAGHTVVLVSHDPRTVSTFCTRAVLLDAGRIVCDGPAPEVAERYVSVLTAPVGPGATSAGG